MTFKLTVELPSEEVLQWVVSFLALVEARLGVVLTPTFKEAKASEGPASVGGAKVKYIALGDLSVLRDLGEATIVGLIYQHLVTEGAKSAREIEQEKLFKRKTVESSLTTLRTMGLVQSIPVAEAVNPLSGQMGTGVQA